MKELDATEWESHQLTGQIQAWEETIVQEKAYTLRSVEKGTRESLPKSQ